MTGPMSTIKAMSTPVISRSKSLGPFGDKYTNQDTVYDRAHNTSTQMFPQPLLLLPPTTTTALPCSVMPTHSEAGSTETKVSMTATVINFSQITCGADFVIHTSDGVDLQTHRAILSIASEFWRDLLSLPQSQHFTTEANTVTVAESSDVLVPLLTLLYPVPSAETLAELSRLTLDALVPLLDASAKYLLSSATHQLSLILRQPQFMQRSPLQVYSLACRFDLEDLKRDAAEACLSIDLTQFEFPMEKYSSPDLGGQAQSQCQSRWEVLKHMTAYEYHKLLAFQQTRSKLAQYLISRRSLRLDPLAPPPFLPAGLSSTLINLSPPCPQCSATAHFGPALPPKWWITFERAACEELRKRPGKGSVDAIFDLGGDFMRRVVKDCGCVRCGTSLMLEAAGWLDELKKELKVLESLTIDSLA